MLNYLYRITLYRITHVAYGRATLRFHVARSDNNSNDILITTPRRL